MSMLRTCAVTGCGTRSFGTFCIAHEAAPASREPRRRRPEWRSSPSGVEPRPLHTSASPPHATDVQDVAREPDDQKQEGEARPRRWVPDLVALSVKEHAGSHGGGDEERKEELRC